ncbi:MAG: helix-turn-helix domain-containing protein [Bacteroidia bacterium]
MNFQEIHIDWLGGLILIGLYQGLITGLLLWFRKEGKRITNRILAGMLIGLSFGLMKALWVLNPDIDIPNSGLLGFSFGPAPFLYGPAIYFYIRTYINREFHFQWIHALHLLPFVGGILFRLVSEFVFDESVATIIVEVQAGNPPFSMRVLGTVLMTQIISYLFFSLRLVQRYRRFVRTTAAFEEQAQLRWINWVILVLLFPFLTGMFSLLILGPINDFPTPAIAALGMIGLLSFFYLVRPTVLDGVVPELAIEAESELEPTRYVSSSLVDKQKQRYSEQLLEYMEEHKPYRSQTLTLSELAEALGINSKYLSQVINELHDLNFMDFINGYRIRAAQEMLTAARYKHYTIMAIAQEVGFRSRSAFYTAFKKLTGQTPTEFKKGG